jgi:hypothetical protein
MRKKDSGSDATRVESVERCDVDAPRRKALGHLGPAIWPFSLPP